MPAVFQRLSDAIRVVMLQRSLVDALLGMLDDFLGFVYRKLGELDAALFGERGNRLRPWRKGISKQDKKGSPAAWAIT